MPNVHSRMAEQICEIVEILGIEHIDLSIRNKVQLGEIISTRQINRGQVILRVRWSTGEITDVDLKDFLYVHNGRNANVEYQNSIIATELIEIIKDHNTNTNSNNYCIGYIRVSSAKDLEHQLSIQHQLINLRDFARRNNMKIYNVLIHNGVSAGPKPGTAPHLRHLGTPNNMNRLDFNIFMGNFIIENGTFNTDNLNESRDYFQQHNITALYVSSVDRLTRMTHGFRLIHEYCNYCNVRIHSGIEGNSNNSPISDTGTGRDEMFRQALKSEIEHVDFCISAQNGVRTRRTLESLNDLSVDERPTQRRRTSSNVVSDEELTSQHAIEESLDSESNESSGEESSEEESSEEESSEEESSEEESSEEESDAESVASNGSIVIEKVQKLLSKFSS